MATPKPLQAILTRLVTLPKENPFSITLPELYLYIPEHSVTIMKELAKPFVAVINTGDVTKASPVFDFILYLFKMVDRPDLKFYEPFLAQKDCFQGLFKFTKKIELRAFKIIELLLHKEPLKVVAYVKDRPRDLRPLCELVASEESNDAGRLLHALTVAKLDEIMPKLQNFITPHFKLYPVATAIDFMLATETSPYSMRRLIPPDQLPSWLLKHESFSVSDVEIVTRWDQELWVSSDVAFQMFLKSGPPDRIRDIVWMHERPASQVRLTAELAKECIKQVRAADQSQDAFKPGVDTATTKNPYLFIRFFVLSLADPAIVDGATLGVLTKAISDECEFLAGAAMQCYGNWVMKYDFQVPSEVVFRTAARAVKGRAEFAGLAKCLLHIFGKSSGLAGTILRNDADVRFARSEVIKVKREPLVFPHFADSITRALTIQLFDDLEAHFVIGCIMDYFERDDEEGTEEVSE